MPLRALISAATILAVGALALVVTLGPAVFGSPPASPAAPTTAPIAQASPSPGPVAPTPGRTEAPSPSVAPTRPPSPPPVALPYEPPDCEIYKVHHSDCATATSEPNLSEPSEPSEPGEPAPSEPSAAGGDVPPAVPPGSSGAVASRVVIPSRGIDLPVVSGELRVRGNRNNYPLCDVAQYLTYFVQPGEEGTTYIYSHAQRGMFLPLLRASRRDDGKEMIGARVEVYTTDSKLWVYEIYRVKRHSTNLKIGYNVDPGEQRLVLQTSEGPPGVRPVLQIAARPVSVSDTTKAKAMPTSKPRVCLPPRR